ncbi:MAG: hypothetical protein R3283_10955, partial [Balneolaceae bacterium]|nr:hypothetical protein [Balneolaceae bacterium]
GENIDNPGVRETDPISNNQASESDQNLNQNQNQNGDQNLNFDENVSETETLAAIPDLQEAQSPDSAVPSDPVSQNAIGLTEHSHFDYKRIPTGENLNTGSGLTVSGYSEYSTQHTFAAIREPDYVRSEQPFYTQGPDLKDARSTFEGQSSRLTVAIALSPDVTGAGTVSGFRDPGYKAGAFLEYALTKRLSVSVGIVQTEVNYKAPSSEYDPPYYWQPGTSPSEIIATCLMLDLPLTFKYNLFQFERSRIYSSATLSSYYMQNEEYQFRYSGATQGGPDGYNETGNKAYWFSNAGVSIGYEFDLNQTWSLRAEPFLRLPLREVGWGNARLYSMGTFISLNYRI